MHSTVRVHGRIDEIDAKAWDSLDHGPSPFLRHGFLGALEASRSIGGRSGWTPAYLCAYDGARLVGAVAAFVKTHSYAEYIFDFGWASAAHRAGVPYYPKLVIAAPMTPATGTRILLAPELGAHADLVRRTLVAAVRALADQADCSSIHWLFCTADEQAALASLGFTPRASYQYHWQNAGWPSWDAFLGALKSRKRKQLRKERERVKAACAPVAWIAGGAADTSLLDDVDRWYRATVDAHGGSDYLRPGFFHEVARRLPDVVQFAEVRDGDGARVAGAIFFETPAALYGRYWGADRHVELLHFETAYYAGIERCCARGTPLFEAGAQGEHKLVRGFLPHATYSAHWLRHPGLASAIDDFCAREARAIAREMQELAASGPFRAAGEPD